MLGGRGLWRVQEQAKEGKTLESLLRGDYLLPHGTRTLPVDQQRGRAVDLGGDGLLHLLPPLQLGEPSLLAGIPQLPRQRVSLRTVRCAIRRNVLPIDAQQRADDQCVFASLLRVGVYRDKSGRESDSADIRSLSLH